MKSYLERYLAGERRDVWAELVGLGPAVREEGIYADARAVADEMMGRARENVSRLVERLRELGYRFAYPDRVWVPPDAERTAALDALERRIGPLPVVVRAWLEVVGSVNFLGAHPKLSLYRGLEWSESDAVVPYGDPLLIETSVGDEDGAPPLPFYISRAASFEEMDQMEANPSPPYGLEFGADPITKANESGSGPIFVMVPNPCFDAPILDSAEWGGTFFVPYLRACFMWGGFPGLRGGWYPGQTWAPSDSKSEVEYLTVGLLPL